MKLLKYRQTFNWKTGHFLILRGSFLESSGKLSLFVYLINLKAKYELTLSTLSPHSWDILDIVQNVRIEWMWIFE